MLYIYLLLLCIREKEGWVKGGREREWRRGSGGEGEKERKGVSKGMCMSQCLCGDQSTIFRNLFSPSTVGSGDRS